MTGACPLSPGVCTAGVCTLSSGVCACPLSPDTRCVYDMIVRVHFLEMCDMTRACPLSPGVCMTGACPLSPGVRMALFTGVYGRCVSTLYRCV
jgi:hypothetical protein